MALVFKELDYVKIVGTNGDFRFGCIQKVSDDGWVIEVSFYDEGLNKIEYDSACGGISAQEWAKELTCIEKKIIPLLAVGASTAQIANEMQIVPVTARAYIRLLRIKLGLENRTQLMAFAHGLNKAWEGKDGQQRTPDPDQG